MSEKGFTLLEILLVIALIAILAGIVIVAINPAKQLAEGRNVQRGADVNTILNAVYQYAIDNDGIMPSGISVSFCPGPSTNEICRTDAAFCTDLVNLGVLTDNETYITAVPIDPVGSTTNGTGYHISKSTGGRVTVCAPHAELGQTISVTK